MAAEIRPPKSFRKSTASAHQTPVTSQANETKMWFRAISEYLIVLRDAERSAADPAKTLVAEMHDLAKVSETVTSQATLRPRFQGINDAPSGLFIDDAPLDPCMATAKPAGSFCAWICALWKERQTASFSRLCLVCLPGHFVQEKKVQTKLVNN